jgi:hypothetical protein
MPRRRPPFISRNTVLPDSRVHPTDEAFDLKSANRSPYDLASVFVSLAACLSKLFCSGHSQQRA